LAIVAGIDDFVVGFKSSSLYIVVRSTTQRNGMGYEYDDWEPYVSVGERRANARSFADKLAKKQKRVRQPIEIQGRKIAKSFWGIAWCDHLKSLSDMANRLPRGVTYVRNGSVVDLVIQPGKVNAIVAGSDPYEITISIKKLNQKTWDNIKKDCSSAIDSLIDLLGGRLSDGVMRRLTDKKSGCFPSASQIDMDCNCPDWSRCCKHLAAVMYAIGSRLDSEPELLFLLRGVNQEELISQAVSKENLDAELTDGSSSDLAPEDLSSIFGIELDSIAAIKPKSRKTNACQKTVTKKSVVKKKPAIKKTLKRKPTTKTAATKKEVSSKKKAKKKSKAKASTKRSTKQATTKKKAVKPARSAKSGGKKKKKSSAAKSRKKKSKKLAK